MIPLGVRRVCICDPCVCAIYIITSQYAETVSYTHLTLPTT